MKRYLFLVICFVFLFNTFGYAASPKISVSCEVDSIENSYVIYGTIDDLKAGDSVYLYAYLDSNQIDFSHTYSYFNGSNVEYKFDAVKISSEKPSGTLKFVVKAKHIASQGEYQCEYYGADLLFNALKAVKGVLGGNVTDLLSKINQYKNELGVDIATAMNLSEKGKNKFKASMDNLTLDLISEDTEKILGEAQKFRTAFLNALMIGTFYDMTDFSAWYASYEDTLQIETFDKTVSDYISEVKDLSGLSTSCSSTASEITTLDALKERIRECVLLAKISISNSEGTKIIYDKYSQYFISSYYSQLNSVELGTVFSKVCGKNYDTYREFIITFENEAKLLLGGSNNSSGNNGNTGGGGGGRNWGAASSNEITLGDTSEPQTPTLEAKKIFSDIEENFWACNAIKYLYEKNIINGKTASIFAPNDDITRAEFIKMIVSLGNYKRTGTEKNVFSDMSEEDWFYNYMMIAYDNGIIKGNENGGCNPNDRITRQDMAVIIQRAFFSDVTETYDTDFSDKDLISDYAKNSVGYLYFKGMINGMGDGSFGAVNFATRAQAAQILYNTVN